MQAKKCISSCIITNFLLTVLSIAYAAQTPQPISFEQALHIARLHNPTLQAQHASVRASHAALQQANSLHWPKIDFNITGARSDNPLSVFGYKLSQGNARFSDFGAAEFTGPGAVGIKPAALNHPGYYSNINTAFTLNLPIYTGGNIRAQQTQKRALWVSARLQRHMRYNHIAYQIYQAYEGFLTAQAMTRLAKKQELAAKHLLTVTEALATQHITLESDVLLTNAYLEQAKIGVTEAKMQQKTALHSFRTLLGQPYSRFVPKHAIPLQQHPPHKKILIQEILRNNPSLRALRAQLKARKAALISAQSRYKPQLDLQLRQEWNGNTPGSAQAANAVMLGAHWQIFSAGERAGAIQEATARTQALAYTLKEQCHALQHSLQDLEENEQLLRHSLRVNKRIAQHTIRAHKALQKRFGRGLLPINALLETQTQLTRIEAQQLQSSYQLHLIAAHRRMLNNQLIQEDPV